jgi:hypothetical protein
MFAVLCLAILMVPACGGNPERVGPRKAAGPMVLGFKTTVRLGNSFRVRIDTIDGPALPMAKLLAQAAARGLEAEGVPATTKAAVKAGFVLRGRASRNPAQAVEKDGDAPYAVVIHWTLFDAKGRKLGSYIQGVRGEYWRWQYGDPRIIRTVGFGVAKPVLAMIQAARPQAAKVQGAPEAAAGVASGEDIQSLMPPLRPRSAILVRAVAGAPGDGDATLLDDIKAALLASDVSITEDARQAALVLDGLVAVGPAKGGRQRVRIVWTVTRRDGGEVGRAIQENTVPEGLLDGSWGNVAAEVAAAAVEGVERVLGRVDYRGPLSGPPPAAMPTPRLPQVPGRAPPPD